jgi:hypothetical protein
MNALKQLVLAVTCLLAMLLAIYGALAVGRSAPEATLIGLAVLLLTALGAASASRR